MLTTRKDRCVIITSHNPDDMAICDRILFLHKGASIATGTQEALEKLLKDIQTVVVKCPSFGDEMMKSLQRIKGVTSVLIDDDEGKRGEAILKVGIRQNEATVSDIIDFFIEEELPILEIRMKKASLQEVYEYHVSLRQSEQMKDEAATRHRPFLACQESNPLPG